jgi:hypothetical protein
MRQAWIYSLALGVLLLASCGGGGGAATTPQPGVSVDTGVVDGYITETDSARAASAAGGGISDVEVWCEEPGTGERYGQDISDASGHYRIAGLPAEQELQLRFQYTHRYEHGSGGEAGSGLVVEGAQQIRLQTREQLRIDLGICEQDTDGDGEPDEVVCDNTQMQVRLRDRAQDGTGTGNGNGGK